MKMMVDNTAIFVYNNFGYYIDGSVTVLVKVVNAIGDETEEIETL